MTSRKRDWLYMLGKELLVSVGLGVTMAAAISAVAFFRVDPVDYSNCGLEHGLYCVGR